VGVLVAFTGLPLVLWLTRASPAFAVTSVGVVICLVLRRFEGYQLGRAAKGAPDSWVERLLFDRVPSRPISGAQPIDSES
jgi:hypothetical protein